MKKQRGRKKSIKEIETKKNYSGEASPYWEDVMRRAQRDAGDGTHIAEDPIANPDVLSEDDHMYHRPLDPEGEFKFKVIREIVPTLSPQQQRLLHMCGMEGQTVKDAAKKLGITPSTAQVFLQRARETITRIYAARRARAIIEGEL